VRARQLRRNKKKTGKKAPAATDTGRLESLALSHFRSRQYDKAIVWFEKIVRLRPFDADARNNLAVACKMAGRLEKARAHFQKALELQPAKSTLWVNLGNVCRQLGDLAEARRCYEQGIALDPDSAIAHHHLGNVLKDLGDHEAALAAYQQAVAREPKNPGYLLGLGTMQHLAGDLPAAAATLARARELAPHDPNIANNLANLYRDTRRLAEAVATYRQAMDHAPPGSWIHSNLLLALHYLCEDPHAIFAEHRRFGHALERLARRPSRPRPMRQRPIHIGYLSADFRRHPVASFIEPILANHDRDRFQVFCYFTGRQRDAVTDRLAAMVSFRDIAALDDETAARTIRNDGIDILVDLSGHTQGNRLQLLARKPAPIQATWIGYPDTTGLTAVDYRITDAVADPAEAPVSMVEQPARLPRVFLCYRPPADVPPEKGPGRPLTLGSCNALAKITDAVLDCWAALLRDLPESRLHLKNASLGNDWLRTVMVEEFVRRGVPDAEKRLQLTGFLPRIDDHLAFYNDIDIALDTFPYNGTTTTCEALWMGTPVVTLAGVCHAGRVGASLLTTIGKSEWIAATTEEYHGIVSRLAADVETVRRGAKALRQRLQDSPLMDEAGFCRELETMYASWLTS